MKHTAYILIIYFLVVPAAAIAMPPHPKLVDEWRKQGILNEKIKTFQQRSETLKAKSLRAGTIPQKSMPVTGTVKICVLLVNFSDAIMDTSSNETYYSSLFNGTASPTLEKYYNEMSNGNLDLQFEVHGPYTVSKTHNYYGIDTAGNQFPFSLKNFRLPSLMLLLIASVTGLVIVSIIFCSSQNNKKTRTAILLSLLTSVIIVNLYGCTGSESSTSKTPVEGNDAHPAALVIEAINKADNSGVDFSAYDNDCIIIIHQGIGQEVSGESVDIWSHQWDLASAKYYGDGTGPVTVDGVTFNVYTIQPEYTHDPGDSTIGVFAHEMGHVLGLPDLYDTADETNGVGDWSLMADGSWCGQGTIYDGSRPAPLLAWERYKIGGTAWLTISQISIDSNNVTIDDIESTRTVYKITLGTSTNQYLLLEGKKSSSQWKVPGTGILVTHIHEGIISSYTSSDTVNAGYYRVHGVNIVEADGNNDLRNMNNYGTASDLFYSGNKASLTDSTNPNTKYYISELESSKTAASGVSITGISSNTFPMNFDVTFYQP